MFKEDFRITQFNTSNVLQVHISLILFGVCTGSTLRPNHHLERGLRPTKSRFTYNPCREAQVPLYLVSMMPANHVCSLCETIGDIEHIDTSGAECTTSHLSPCTPCVQLNELDARIRDTTALLKQLYYQRCELKMKRNQHHDRLVNRLPVEILSRILHLDIEDETLPYDPYHHQSPSSRSLKLAAVCQRWRHIAHSTPQLWTTTSVAINHRNVPLYAKLTRDWLSRSGSLPLDLYIYEVRRTCGDEEDTFGPAPIFEAINEQAYRWLNLSVWLRPGLLKYLRGACNAPYIIRTLGITTFSPFTESNPPFSFNDANSKPRPREVVLYGTRFRSVGICWDEVAHLNVSRFSLRDCFEVLQNCPNLTVVEVSDIEREDAAFPMAINHNELRSLRVLHLLGFVPGPLLDMLTLPGLEDLHVRSSFVALANLLERSSPPIRDLWFAPEDSLTVGGEALVRLLELTPLLTHLIMKYVTTSHIFFDRLVCAGFTTNGVPTVPDFLPHLRLLHISCESDFQWPSLTRIIPSRLDPHFQSPALLSEFRFEWGSSDVENTTEWEDMAVVDYDLIYRLRALREAGVNVSVVDEMRTDLLDESIYLEEFTTHRRQFITGAESNQHLASTVT
ncbi:unnamed protein product [Cyclocybe aegerita]|uniref:F-box domain-containing protein n=1 Tax=Cyclocybe aegerita TaxID=1973307 RepID=A0A8S0W6T9_CYCAE|nr:unnamed protein product [Cyclocybe aegerita]